MTRDLPEGVFAAGNPCRVIREIHENLEADDRWRTTSMSPASIGINRLPAIPCTAMSETSLNGWKMCAIHATGRWVHFGCQSPADFPDCGL